MGHPDFRVEGRLFATLGYPDGRHGMVKLAPPQQEKFVKMAPGVFSPCAGLGAVVELQLCGSPQHESA